MTGGFLDITCPPVDGNMNQPAACCLFAAARASSLMNHNVTAGGALGAFCKPDLRPKADIAWELL